MPSLGLSSRAGASVGLVEVGAEQHRAADARAGLDVRADADDRLFHDASFERAAFRDDRLAGHAVDKPRAWQEVRLRVDRAAWIVERKRRIRLREHDVRCVERIDRSDVRPVPVEQVRFDAIAIERPRDDLAAEIGRRVRVSSISRSTSREKTYIPIDATNGLSGECAVRR